MKTTILNRIKFDRSLNSYSKIQNLYGNLIRCNHLQLKNKNFDCKRYLNVGCGSNVVDGFVNLDYMWLPGVDLVWDITKNIPFKDNRFYGIYSEHCLEHISYQETKFVLFEFFRLLKPSGSLRIVVPNAELYLEIYLKRKTGEKISFPYGQTAHNILDKNITSMMVVNSVFRGHGHQYAYDFETLKSMLENQGFENIQKAAFKQGEFCDLLMDSKVRACESLYIEAVKPS